jgi:hypothetical protein
MTKQITNIAQFKPLPKSRGKIGMYLWSDANKLARSANGTNCPLSIDIFAEPCTIVGDAFNCNSTGGSTIDAGQTDLANLAVGDEFTTSDYTIVVTEASKTGTTFIGKGKLIFNFLKISNTLALQIPISVTFTGIKINQCYQLYSGKVVTEYDESWNKSITLDTYNFFNNSNQTFQSIGDELPIINCQNKGNIQQLISDYKTKVSNDNVLSSQAKTTIIAKITLLENKLNEVISCLNCNGTSSSSPNCSNLIVETSARLQDLSLYISTTFSPTVNDLDNETIQINPYFSDEDYSNSRINTGEWIGCSSLEFLIEARRKGVEREVFSKFSTSSNDVKQTQLLARLGRIFEITVLKSLGYNNTNGKSFPLIDKSIRKENPKPDQIQGGGSKIVILNPPNPIPKETRWYQWPESVFIEAKYTMQAEQIINININDNQFRGYFNVLDNMDNGLYTKTRGLAPALNSSFVPKKIKPGDYGAAAIHIIVPSGVNLHPLILSEAAIKNIKIYKSHLEWRRVDHVFASEPYEFRVSDAVCQNCNSLLSAPKFLKVGVLPRGNITYGQWHIK